MKKLKMLTLIALTIMLSCSKEKINNTEQASLRSDKSNLYTLNGVLQAKPSNLANPIVFYSNSIADGIFVVSCLPTGKKLLKHGSFSGNVLGKINPSLSTYEFVSCQELPINPPNVGEPLMYAIVAVGQLALNSKDYCKITISGNIYPWYYTDFGYYGGNFIGTAITESGAGKLKGLNNKRFEVYSGSPTGPTINLETGTISLRLRETQ
jgi:hypothetical protein